MRHEKRPKRAAAEQERLAQLRETATETRTKARLYARYVTDDELFERSQRLFTDDKRWGGKGNDESPKRGEAEPKWRKADAPEQAGGNGHLGRRPPPKGGTGCGTTILLFPLTLLWRR
jgi:hypothetical protein